MRRPGRIVGFATPIKALGHRVPFLGLVALAAGLLVLGKAEAPLVERLRMAVSDAFAPILDGFARPVATVTALRERVSEAFNLYGENARLREENQRLLQWQNVARRLVTENSALRDLARAPSEPAITFVTARVVANAGGPFVQSVLVGVGANDGVAKGWPAATEDGLVGRVTSIGARSARILLLTDFNSQVPVLLEDLRERALLTGDNTDRPKLLLLPAIAKPKVGDRVVTSGHGGVFPPGIPVGIVVAGEDGAARVQPFVAFHRLEYVRLIDYGLEGALPTGAPPPPSRRGGK